MFAKNNVTRVGILSIFWLLLSGCGLFGGRSDLVGQNVAFPQPGEGPPTSEGALPLPIIISSITPEPQASETNEPPTSPAETAVPFVPTRAPTISSSTAVPPRILAFSADVTNAVHGKTISFSWESTGGRAARLYNWANGSSRFPAFWDVPPTGSLTVNLTGTRRRDPHFELFVYAGEAGDAAPSDTRSLQIPWDCSLDYFFQPGSDICPHTLPTYTTATMQQFQGGRMLWLEALDWIYVLYDEVYPGGGQGGDLQWERFDDHWTEADAEIERFLAPPEGFYAPVGGFSLIWQDNPAVQERLGWGVSSEIVFDSAWQLQPSDTDYPGDGSIFILMGDGQVGRLSGFDTWGWLWSAVEPIKD